MLSSQKSRRMTLTAEQALRHDQKSNDCQRIKRGDDANKQSSTHQSLQRSIFKCLPEIKAFQLIPVTRQGINLKSTQAGAATLEHLQNNLGTGRYIFLQEKSSNQCDCTCKKQLGDVYMSLSVCTCGCACACAYAIPILM